MLKSPERHIRYFAAMIMIVATLLVSSCGGGPKTAVDVSSNDADPIAYGSTVIELSRELTFADFESAGVKHGKDYNIEGLPGAVSASLGFYDARDIEFRFFPDHDVALSEGVPVAHEIVGPDVLIKRENVTWPWGTADEKACSARVPGGGRDCTKSPKYGDFVVYGNVIMFCQAANAEEARALCREIYEQVP